MAEMEWDSVLILVLCIALGIVLVMRHRQQLQTT